VARRCLLRALALPVVFSLRESPRPPRAGSAQEASVGWRQKVELGAAVPAATLILGLRLASQQCS